LELIFEEGIEVELTEACSVELPAYVSRLSPEDISLIMGSPNPENKVIAAGTDPRDGMITLLTASGKVMVFNAAEFYIPHGPALPTQDGTRIHLPNVDGRWPGMEDGCLVDSGWMLQNSRSGLLGAVLTTPNYSHEDTPK